MIYFISLLTIIHSNLSNSVFGFNSPIISIALFCFINFLIIFDCLVVKNIKSKNIILALLFIQFILLWYILPDYKFYFGMFLVFCISYYIYLMQYMLIVAQILKFFIYISAFLIIIQISGLSEFVHSWNSFYIDNVGTEYFRKIIITNILFSTFEEYSSNQVRPPGIFHSSAVLSMVLISYIAYIYNGYIKSFLSLLLIGYLVIFVGSKAVLIAFILFNLIRYEFFLKNWLVISFGFFSAIIVHNLLFPGLLKYNFDINFFIYSFDIRFQEYYKINFDELYKNINYIVIFFSIVFIFYFTTSKYLNKKFLISFFSIVICLLTNNHLNNYLAGIFLFPLLWSSYE